MSVFKNGSYTIYLKSNKITIISNSRRFFQKEIFPKDLYSCETKEDVYKILYDLLESDNINIYDNNLSNVVLSFYIKTKIKDEYIIIYLPEIENEKLPFDYSLMKIENEIYEIKSFSFVIMILTILNLLTNLLL
jgi:hypothetical protein